MEKLSKAEVWGRILEENPSRIYLGERLVFDREEKIISKSLLPWYVIVALTIYRFFKGGK